MRRPTSSPKADAFRGSGGRGLTKCAENGTNRLALRRSELQRVRPNGRRGPVRGPRQIDALDQGIIEALQTNGRESFRRIAERLGVSEATVRARYTRLSEGEMLQVVAVTNPLGLGFEQALVGVKTAGSPDALAGLFAVQIGYSYGEEMGEAAAAQMRELPFYTNWSYAHPRAIELAHEIASLTPGDLNRVFFVSGGSEAVESAWKLARQYYAARGEQRLKAAIVPSGGNVPTRVDQAYAAAGARRWKAVSHRLAYHGTTMGALSIN